MTERSEYLVDGHLGQLRFQSGHRIQDALGQGLVLVAPGGIRLAGTGRERGDIEVDKLVADLQDLDAALELDDLPVIGNFQLGVNANSQFLHVHYLIPMDRHYVREIHAQQAGW